MIQTIMILGLLSQPFFDGTSVALATTENALSVNEEAQ